MFKNLVIRLIFTAGVFFPSFSGGSVAVVDPEGLNVRCQNRTNQSNRLDQLELPVDRIMPTGERFEAVGISLDRRGKPWIWVIS
jgi:hypothetical protein